MQAVASGQPRRSRRDALCNGAAAGYERKIGVRDLDHQTVIRANQAAATQRAQQITSVRAEQDRAARDQELRARLAAAMTPDQVAACDHARTAWQTEQRRHSERVPAPAASRDPIEWVRQTVAARRARDATLARQLGVAWDPDATGTAKARQTMTLQQAAGPETSPNNPPRTAPATAGSKGDRPPG